MKCKKSKWRGTRQTNRSGGLRFPTPHGDYVAQAIRPRGGGLPAGVWRLVAAFSRPSARPTLPLSAQTEVYLAFTIGTRDLHERARRDTAAADIAEMRGVRKVEEFAPELKF